MSGTTENQVSRETTPASSGYYQAAQDEHGLGQQVRRKPVANVSYTHTGYEPAYNQEDDSILADWTWPENFKPRMWTPIWLSRTSLLVFAGVYLAMIIATALLFHFSEKYHGISVQNESNHYAWKYGPTLVLVIVGAFWKQVDNANKVLAPWHELRHGPVSADKSLLLDYISPILPVGLWTALKNRHWAVAISTLGQLLILGTTVFSTGLLILEPTIVTKDKVSFQLKSQFQLAQDIHPNTPAVVGPTPAQIYYGVNFQGLHYPAGTGEDMVVPALDIPSAPSSSYNYSTITNGLKINYDCEVLDIKNGTKAFLPWASILAPFIITDVKTKDCTIKGAMLAEGPDHYYYHDQNATQNYQSLYSVYPCNLEWNFGQQFVNMSNETQVNYVFNTSADQRVLMSVVDLRISRFNASQDGPSYMYLANVTAALCKPSYQLGQYQVGLPSSADGSAQAILSSPSKKSFQAFPNGALGMAVGQSADNWIIGNGGVDYKLSETVPTFFQLMTMKAGAKTIGDFLDPKLLVDTGTDVFKGIATQALNQLAVQPANQSATGSITFTEDRLRVKSLSTGFMCGFLGLLMLLSLALIFLRFHVVVPSEPGSIVFNAAILAASPHLEQILYSTSTMSLERIEERISGYKFRSVLASEPVTSFLIEPSQQTENPAPQTVSLEQDQTVPSWKPMAGQVWFFACAVGVPLLAIAALEIVQHYSDKNDGFVNVRQSTSLALATYIPAAIALGISGLYTSIEFMTSLFTPYSALKRGRAPAGRSVLLNLVGKLFLEATFLAGKTKHFAVIFALLAYLIGSFLSVVISGLYSTVAVSQFHVVPVHQTDAFNFTGVDISLTDNQATAVHNLIEYLGLNSTKWTYNDLVFNHFEQSTIPVTNASANTPLTGKLPAVRARLNCTSVPNTSRQVTIMNSDANGGDIFTLPYMNGEQSPVPGRMYVGVNTTLNLAGFCQNSAGIGGSEVSWLQYFSIPNNTGPAYVGKATTMTWSKGAVFGDGAVDPGSGGGYADGLVSVDAGCPTFAVTFGTLEATAIKKLPKGWKGLRSTFTMDLGTLLCYQNVEQVTANVTWQLPDFNIDADALPTTNESSVKYLKTTQGSDRFPFIPNAWLNGLSDPVINKTIPGPNNTDPSNNNLDDFIKLLINGRDGVPMNKLQGSKNIEMLFNTSQALYGTYMSQAISLNMRSNSSQIKESSLPTFNGTVTISGRNRLRQNKGPKIALEVMLACMVVFGIVTRLLMPLNNVLPHNPCSIAGAASLLAGAKMATNQVIPPGAEWVSHKELKGAGLLVDSLYSLKWWQDEKGGSRYGIDVDLDPPS